MRDSIELSYGEAPATASEDRLGCFLEEALHLKQSGHDIDVAALLADRPDLIDQGRRLIEGMESLRRAAATTTFAPAQSTDEAPLPNPFPDDFRIRKLLGKGSFGKVWLADDLHLGRQVALKTLHLPAEADPSALEALRKEATILASLDNRNVVKVHAWRQAGGEHYLVLEYVAGGSLADLVKEEGPMSWQRAARYVANVAEGLVEVHDRGIVHRDIKASNMLWEPARDEAKLTDFGVAGRLGATRTTVGTLAFMAPEARDGHATAASDVYGLAATLFHLTTGELPFTAVTADQLAAGAARGLPQSDDRFRLVPQRLEGIIRAGLAADQRARPLLPRFIDLLWGALNQTMVDEFLPRLAEEKAATPVRLRMEVSRRTADGWRPVASTQPPTDSLRRDIRRVPPRPAQARVRTGEPLLLEVEADRPGYLAVFNVGPTGNLNRLYPLIEYGDAPTDEASRPVRIDDLVLSPPAGRERMFAVWSSTPLPVSIKELRSIAEEDGGSTASRSSRDIVRVRQAVEETSPAKCRVEVLELEHEPVS
ncbi:MAG TPA: serine/threonine-protein kinase [Gemmataceae bacterium]|nr:serine/threonine-protein kinase [Gemmataceae bacterium]